MHQSILKDSQPVILGYGFGVIPRDRSCAAVAADLQAQIEEQDPDHETRMNPTIRLDAVARTVYAGRTNGRAYAILTAGHMKDDAMRLLEACPRLQINEGGAQRFRDMFFVSIDDWQSISANKKTTK